MNQNIIFEQKAKIRMTNNMVASLDLLTASSYKLGDILEDYAMENPFISLVKPKKIRNQNDYIENISATGTTSLDQYILNQLWLLTISNNEKLKLVKIISLMDSKGFLPYDISFIAKGIDETKEKTVKLLNRIKQLEPVGVDIYRRL